jgi:hypothetical protein
MRQILHCHACGAALSRAVEIGDKAQGERPAFADLQHILPRGWAYRSDKAYRQGPANPRDPLDFAPQVWMTILDIRPTVGLTPLTDRLNGCCGMDGCNGPNRICACGAHVGTEMSDCWTSWLFIPDPEATEWQPAD